MTNSQHHCWSHLPVDLLTEVTQHLPYRDVLHFGVVCRPWKRAIPDDRRVILCQGRCSRPKKRRALEQWDLKHNPTSTLTLPFRPRHPHLVKSDGELLFAVRGQRPRFLSPRVYRFDCSSLENWDRVDSLRGRVLILSPSTLILSLAVGAISAYTDRILHVEGVDTLRICNIA
ncbi:hypothetical protein ACLB2K_022837 [Fragaria x ananassa]